MIDNKWYVSNGEMFEPTGENVDYENSYYLDLIADLKQQVVKREEVSSLCIMSLLMTVTYSWL